jgi:predicted ArsR family transcriptional regulator
MVTLLRRGRLTLGELASAVGLTNNGVRAHLCPPSSGPVSSGSGGGKPAYVYGLTQGAEDMFPKAHEPVLRHLPDVLSEGLGDRRGSRRC